MDVKLIAFGIAKDIIKSSKLSLDIEKDSNISSLSSASTVASFSFRFFSSLTPFILKFCIPVKLPVDRVSIVFFKSLPFYHSHTNNRILPFYTKFSILRPITNDSKGVLVGLRANI